MGYKKIKIQNCQPAERDPNFASVGWIGRLSVPSGIDFFRPFVLVQLQWMAVMWSGKARASSWERNGDMWMRRSNICIYVFRMTQDLQP